MKKLLIILLLMSHLGASLAFAWDTHPEAIAGHDTLLLNILSDSTDWAHNSNNDQKQEQGCHADHCCHASVHLLGLVFQSESLIIANLQQLFISYSQSFVAYAIPPLLRPPIV